MGTGPTPQLVYPHSPIVAEVGEGIDHRDWSHHVIDMRCGHTNQSLYGAVKCRLIWRFRGQALLLRVLYVVACDDVRDCVFLKDDLNSVKNGFNSYELNFSLPTNSQNKLTELN